MNGLEQCGPIRSTEGLIKEWVTLLIFCMGILFAGFAYASKTTPLVSPGLSDDHFWLTHYQEIQVWLGGQLVIFATWVGVQFYNSFIKAKDKTADKLEQLLEASARMQEDIKNIKYSMISKDEAHRLIEDKIKYADELRSPRRN